jgi:hypothetical protein
MLIIHLWIYVLAPIYSVLKHTEIWAKNAMSKTNP